MRVLGYVCAHAAAPRGGSELLGGPRPGRAGRDPTRRCRRTPACSTCTPTATTTGRSSPASASRSSWSRRWPRALRWPYSGSTSAATTAFIPGWAPPTCCRSSASGAGDPTPQDGRAGAGRADRRRSASRCWATPSWAAACGRRSTARGAERLAARLEAGQFDAALRPAAAASDRRRRPARPCATRWSPSTSTWTTADVEVARRIARTVRESSGGLPGVQALGMLAAGRAQVSMNLIDLDGDAAARRGRRGRAAGGGARRRASHGSELVGLMPASVAAAAAGAGLHLPGMAADRLLEVAVGGAFGGNRLPAPCSPPSSSPAMI